MSTLSLPFWGELPFRWIAARVVCLFRTGQVVSKVNFRLCFWRNNLQLFKGCFFSLPSLTVQLIFGFSLTKVTLL